MSFLRKVKQELKNIPGKRLDRQVLVLECDDWGGLRMPSLEAWERLSALGYDVDNRYDRYDTLEDTPDLEGLFEVLASVRDGEGQCAVMTPFMTVANPDFGQIRASGFRDMAFEPLPVTWEKYGRPATMAALWRKGEEEGFFVPQYHGHSHLAAFPWLRLLLQGHRGLRAAFDLGYTAVVLPGLAPATAGFRAELFFEEPGQLPVLRARLEEGIRLFREFRGRGPSVFAPANGVFHPFFEEGLVHAGIRFLYAGRPVWVPDGKGDIRARHFRRWPLEEHRLLHYRRNCVFEPSERGYDGIGRTLEEISAAFRWGKPAVVSTHRVNFCGGLSPENRSKGLGELRQLLKAVARRWPGVRFMDSSRLLAEWLPEKAPRERQWNMKIPEKGEKEYP